TLGTTIEYFNINDIKMVEGNKFSISDFLGGQPVAIINQKLAEELFENESSLEQVIWLADYPIRVIGIAENQGGIINNNSSLSIPWNSYKHILQVQNFNQLTVTVQDAEDINRIGDKVLESLNESNNSEDAYQVLNFEEVTGMIEQITITLTLIIGSIAGISI